jgi:hypothetical protein
MSTPWTSEANPDGGSRRGFTREKVEQVWTEEGELYSLRWND